VITIRKEELQDGRVVWRARGVSVGKDPRTGRRRQRTVSGPTKKAVQAELNKLGVAVDTGTYRAPFHGLVPEVIASYLASGAIGWEANTRLSYAGALAPAAEWFAHRRARDVTREDVERFRDHLLTAGRKRGGAPGTGLSARSVNLSLGQLQAAYDLAERDGKVAANPCRWVRRAKAAESDRATWDEEQVRRFLAAAAGDRLAACWLLSLLGLRRAEVLGLRWSGVSFTDDTLTVSGTRVLVDGKVIEKCPKSKRGHRTLPLFRAVTAALEALYKAQLAERAAAGAAYAGDVDGGYVCADELGRPVHPERYSDEFGRLCALAGLPKCRLHDCRHSTNSLLEKLGVPDSTRARWFGHTVAVNTGTYTHASAADLGQISDALGELFRADVSRV
jgi:integrase